MFDQILIGVAEPERGRDAAELAKLLMSAEGRLTMAHVYSSEHWLFGSGAPSIAAETEQAQAMLAGVRDAVGVEAETRCVDAPAAGRGLHELAEVLGADLLVVGSTRRGFLGRVLLGDDTHAALVGAPCALAVAPAGFTQTARPPRRIGVGYDGSPESEQALALARTLSERYDAQIALLEAIIMPVPVRGTGWLPIEGLLEDARERLAAIDDVEPHAVYGPAGEQLAQFSGTVDLLIVGSRGYGPLGRLVHGSVSQNLARSARCPLLVLPRGSEVRAPGPAERSQRRPRLAAS